MEPRFPSEGSIPEFLAALASPENTYGTLAAATVAGAIGASILHRITAVPQWSFDGDDQAALIRIQEELLETIETHTAVKLFAARSLPQANEAERETREKAIQLALRAAAEVPLEVMRLCADALRHANLVVSRLGRRVSADADLAVGLLEAGFNAARADLEAKLPILTDTSHVAQIGEDIARLSDTTSMALDAVRGILTVPPT